MRAVRAIAACCFASIGIASILSMTCRVRQRKTGGQRLDGNVEQSLNWMTYASNRTERGRGCVKTPAPAPKARNVIAWASGRGRFQSKLLSAESAKCVAGLLIFRAFSASRNQPLPRALPWAVTFRAFGASDQRVFTHTR
jgi:hypothetical protein